MTVIEMALYKYQMEIKLKEREEWLTTILQSIGEGVIATDKTERHLYEPVSRTADGLAAAGEHRQAADQRSPRRGRR